MSEQLQDKQDDLQRHADAIENGDKTHIETESANLRTEMIASLGHIAYEGGYRTEPPTTN